MKLKLKDLKLIASLLPFVILLCAIEMGGCGGDDGPTCEQAKQQLKDADDALDKAKQDVRKAEEALTQFNKQEKQ